MPESESTFRAPDPEIEPLAPAEEDFVFQFRLEPQTQEETGYDDPLLELIRGQIADLLDTVILTDHGRRVRVDGFRLIQNPEVQYDVMPARESEAGPPAE